MKLVRGQIGVILFLLVFLAGIGSASIIAKAESKEFPTVVTTTNGATIKLNGADVSAITPDTFNYPNDAKKTYYCTLAKVEYKDSKIIIPIQVKEEGYLGFEAKGININTMVCFDIYDSTGKTVAGYNGLNNFIASDKLNVARGGAIYTPGTYYIEVKTGYTSMVQELNLNVVFTNSINRTLDTSNPMMMPGMDKKTTYLQVNIPAEGGKLSISHTIFDEGTSDFGLQAAICDTQKNLVDEGLDNLLMEGKQECWTLSEGTYYLRIVTYVDFYTLSSAFEINVKPTTPTLSAVKVGDKIIKGTADKNTTVYVQVGKKTYSTQTDSVGNYSVTVSKLKKNVAVKVYCKNGSLSSETKAVKVKVLKTPTLNKLKAKATKIKGTSVKNATVVVKVGKKTYKTTANSKGKYSVKVSKLKKKAVVKVYVKNDTGISKTKTVTVK